MYTYKGNYGAVIRLKETTAWKCILGAYQTQRVISTNHSAVFPPDHQTTESRQTTVYKTTVVDPSHCRI